MSVFHKNFSAAYKAGTTLANLVRENGPIKVLVRVSAPEGDSRTSTTVSSVVEAHRLAQTIMVTEGSVEAYAAWGDEQWAWVY